MNWPKRNSISSRPNNWLPFFSKSWQLPVVKKTKSGPSTDSSVLEELAVAHPIVEHDLELQDSRQVERHLCRRFAPPDPPQNADGFIPTLIRRSRQPGDSAARNPICKTFPFVPRRAEKFAKRSSLAGHIYSCRPITPRSNCASLPISVRMSICWRLFTPMGTFTDRPLRKCTTFRNMR